MNGLAGSKGVVDAEEGRPLLMGLGRAYTSMGVRMAWVKEQQTAPARAYFGYSARSLSLSSGLATDGLGICWGVAVWTASTGDEGGGGGTGDCLTMKVKSMSAKDRTRRYIFIPHNLHPLLVVRLPSISRIPMRFSALAPAPSEGALIEFRTRRCSFLSASKSSSSCLCHGYRTHT